MNSTPRRFCAAPMMDWSDRHCRYLWRLISKHAWVYSEMVTAGAIIHGDRSRFLDFSEEEHPVALQVGGSNPEDLAVCSELAEQWGYDEINLNCGCPSDRVQNGMIGAVLMGHAPLVGDCIKAMQARVSIPVTVKHRIGIDEMEDYEGLLGFVDTLAASGCKTFIVHARKAWLQGLSPKQNREIPPLRYDLVYRLKQERPELEVIINGGISTIDDCLLHLQHVDGVMVGREAYHNPALLLDVDRAIYGSDQAAVNMADVYEQYCHYCEQQLAQGVKLGHLAKHALGLFSGQRGARRYRRFLSENIHKAGADAQVLADAWQLLDWQPAPADSAKSI